MVLVGVAVVLVLAGSSLAAGEECPWKRPGLLAWSNKNTWVNQKIPTAQSQVVIYSGHHVLLDITPPELKSLTIQAGASLVWGDVDDLGLWTSFILVEGEFHMGSNQCRLKRKAQIHLTGRNSGDVFVPAHNGDKLRKGIVVCVNATMEIHGVQKTSWTRLAQSLPSIDDLACTAVFHLPNQKFSVERSQGLHVIVWNPEGTVADFAIFQTFTGLPEFFKTIPDCQIIGMFAFSKLGLNDRKQKKLDFASLDSVIIGELGGTMISQVSKGDVYSLLAVKGDKSKTVEYVKQNGQVEWDVEQRYIQLPVWKTRKAFQVAKSSKSTFEYFRVMPTEVAYPILELAEEVTNWNAGDQIVVTSTDFRARQVEVREIIDCGGHCSKSQIRVNESFVYRHFGNFTYDVDERAEVGMLTRNILIEGVMGDECQYNDNKEKKRCQRFGNKDIFGGHIFIRKNFKSVHVQGVELYHMGQQGIMARYPFHWHLCDEVKGSWLRDSAIHHSFQRCVTIHGTDYAEVTDIVCYDHLGHGFFLEDSVEQNNVLDHNLGIMTRYGTTLMSDMDPKWCLEDFKDPAWSRSCGDLSTFWITHPNNDVRNNAAAGGWGHGFMYVFAEYPLGLSYAIQQKLKKVWRYYARSTPIKSFYKNHAHSYYRSGIFIDSYISTGRVPVIEQGIPENGIVQEENYYEPRIPHRWPEGRRIWTHLERYTGYKNQRNNAWIKGGDINVTFSSFADAGIQSFSGGCTGFWTGVAVEYCVFIGTTDNLGMPTTYVEKTKSGKELVHHFPGNYGKSPWSTIAGVGIYQGPMLIKHSFFDRYQTQYWNDSWTSILGERPVRPAGGISFKRDSTYPTYTSQYTTNLTFGYCDNVDNYHYLFFGKPNVVRGWEDLDGPKNAHNTDRDGSMTGYPGSYQVRTNPFFTGPECLERKDWGMSVCPYRYIKVDFSASDGSLSKTLKNQWALVARRDDVPDHPFYQKAQQRREYPMRTHKSFLVGFNTTLKGAAFPSKITVQAWGVEKQDMLRLGLCVPKGMTDYDISMTYPVNIRRNNYTDLSSLQELDQFTDPNRLGIFHDKKNGVLFFRIWSLLDRINDTERCPGGVCYKLNLIINGKIGPVRDCFEVKIPPYQDPRPRPAKPTVPPCPGIGTSKGIGATRYHEEKKIVHHDFYFPCAAPVIPRLPGGSLPPENKGCFVASPQSLEAEVRLSKSMTVEVCIRRCAFRHYKFAFLTEGSKCKCGNTIVTSAAAKDIRNRLCSKACSGNSSQTCGNGDRVNVWTTGLQTVPAKPSKCDVARPLAPIVHIGPKGKGNVGTGSFGKRNQEKKCEGEACATPKNSAATVTTAATLATVTTAATLATAASKNVADSHTRIRICFIWQEVMIYLCFLLLHNTAVQLFC